MFGLPRRPIDSPAKPRYHLRYVRERASFYLFDRLGFVLAHLLIPLMFLCQFPTVVPPLVLISSLAASAQSVQAQIDRMQDRVDRNAELLSWLDSKIGAHEAMSGHAEMQERTAKLEVHALHHYEAIATIRGVGLGGVGLLGVVNGLAIFFAFRRHNGHSRKPPGS